MLLTLFVSQSEEEGKVNKECSGSMVVSQGIRDCNSNMGVGDAEQGLKPTSSKQLSHQSSTMENISEKKHKHKPSPSTAPSSLNGSLLPQIIQDDMLLSNSNGASNNGMSKRESSAVSSSSPPKKIATPPAAQVSPKKELPKLMHPILHSVPMQIRFGANGLIGNLIFMVAYNSAIDKFEHVYEASRIYAVVYFLYIPLNHFLVSLIVFGWPERYISSLISNFPIGLTGIAIGAYLTACLDSVDFNSYVETQIENFFHFTTHNNTPPTGENADGSDTGQFYSSMVVLTITSVWTYFLSVLVNQSDSEKEKTP